MEGSVPVGTSVEETFVSFIREVEPRLRWALVARFGADRGREATAEALAYGWEHWERIQSMDNPAGYLFRVGQRKGFRRWQPVVFPDPPLNRETLVEPALPSALKKLSPRQRTSVVLVHCLGWTHGEVAGFLGVSVSTVRNHLRRGLGKLRRTLGVSADV